jgi:formylmethanofuran dehydrogenase subunit B
MGEAWISGKPVTLQAACAEAARLLAASRAPLIAGLGTDVAGARAAIALARRLGAAVDHMHSAALLKDLDVMRDTGWMVTTPGEARLRADCLLLVGAGLTAAWLELPRRLLAAAAVHEGTDASRRVIWLCPGLEVARSLAKDTHVNAHAHVEVIGRDEADLPIVLAALRARVAGRPIGKAPVPQDAIDALAQNLQAARFGVAIWSAASDIDALAVEMLCGLVKDLNAKTRFTGLPLPPPDNAAGVLEACGWTTGYPVRTGLHAAAQAQHGAGHDAQHDPWRFDASRLVDSGETDCVLWISAYRPAAPSWTRDVATIALTGPDARLRRPAQVQIAVGRPGTDHDSVEHLAATGALGTVVAATPSAAVPVAQVIADIAAALPAGA